MQRCLITLSILVIAMSSGAAISLEKCEHLIEDFQLRSGGSGTKPDASKMLWFLHIPRSAGRTFHSCFLKLAHPPSKRCAKSYDVLRLNVSVGSCGLLASHDDYSATDFLPAQAAIVTQLRDPSERVLSAYEFAVEVAARVLTRPSNYTADPSNTITRNVWPWSQLVPLIEQDLLRRVEAEEGLSATKEKLKPVDPYHNSLIMPLAEFVQHPEVDDVLGNGQTMQVLGLTSYSHWPEADQLRECAGLHADVQHRLQQLAEDRVRAMLHVGVMEELPLSIASLAATLGVKLDGPSWRSSTPHAFSYEDDASSRASQDVDQARIRLQQLTLALQAKRREIADGLRRWRDEKTVITAELQQFTQAGQQPQEPEAPDWLRALKREYEQLQADVKAAGQEAAIVRSHEASGPARQILPDDSFQTEATVRDAFYDCSQRAQQRNRQRRATSLGRLVTADGQNITFSAAARRNLHEEVVQLIRSRNRMDSALYSLGKTLLHSRVAQQHAKGLLEHMVTSQHRRPQQARVRERMPAAPPAPKAQPAPSVTAAASTKAETGAFKDEL